jgi:hypothetical protein
VWALLYGSATSIYAEIIYKKGIVAHENEPQAENGSAENGLS